MRIAIVGIGVAGAYLANRLSEKHDVVGFERMHEESHDSICAWGTARGGMSGFAKKCGLDFDNYVLHDGLTLHVDGGRNTFDIRLKGLCTYDKIGLIRDMAKGVKISYGTSPARQDLEKDFDLIVDATGFHRPLLPRPKYELWVPTIQYKVQYERRLYDDFLIRPFPGMTGYFWYFPLENGYAHVGAGDYNRKHIEIVDAFLREHGGRVLKKVGRPIRLSPPALCEPFFDGRVVGVGESIGTVFALLGEGIIPSTTCADLLAENVDDLERYRQEVLDKFKVYLDVFNFVRSKCSDEFSMVKFLPSLIRIYRYMRAREARFGMEMKISDLMKVAKM